MKGPEGNLRTSFSGRFTNSLLEAGVWALSSLNVYVQCDVLIKGWAPTQLWEWKVAEEKVGFGCPFLSIFH